MNKRKIGLTEQELNRIIEIIKDSTERAYNKYYLSTYKLSKVLQSVSDSISTRIKKETELNPYKDNV